MQDIFSIITSCFSKSERLTFASVLINSLTVQNVICGSIADLLQSYFQAKYNFWVVCVCVYTHTHTCKNICSF